jgi:hypothetical protein
MAIEFNKVDAALFAIEGFISRLITHNDNQDHADYYLSMVRSLRGSMARDRFDEVVLGKKEDVSIQQGIRPGPSHRIQPPKHFNLPLIPQGKKKRAGDKGQMSKKQRADISQKMKAYWRKRRKAEKKVGR